jgi:hypothetical protein
VSSSTAVPVGLFGLVTKTTSGRTSRTWAAAAATSMVKSGRRCPSTHDVPVPAEMIGCIEYDGVKPSAVRPAPPNACRICWSTSLEPLAAHTCCGRSTSPLVRVR